MLVVEEVAESMMLVTDPLDSLLAASQSWLTWPSAPLSSLSSSRHRSLPPVFSAARPAASGDSDAPRPGPAQPGPERAVNCERGLVASGG